MLGRNGLSARSSKVNHTTIQSFFHLATRQTPHRHYYFISMAGGGDHKSGLLFGNTASDHGFIVVSMTGLGGTHGTSWSLKESHGPGPDGATCTSEATDYCYEDCNCEETGIACSDNCWWTTCKDSVQQVKEMLHWMLASFCIDIGTVFASGCSNGGMFLYELASDSNVSHYFAGMASFAGQPLNGFNHGPLHPMSFIGMWGVNDKLVPPLSNTEDPTKSFDTASPGWYYSTARNMTDKWGMDLNCGDRIEVSGRWRTGDFTQLNCTMAVGCMDGVNVVECLHPDGHVCPGQVHTS